MIRARAIGFVFLICITPILPATEDRILADFETPDDFKVIESRAGVQLTPEHATHGKQAGKVAAGFKLVANTYTGMPADWSAYDQLKLDVFNTGDATSVSLWISDDKGTDYWQRHNNQIALKPGANTIAIPVGGLYRGEKGSGKFLDTKKIVQLLLIFPESSKDGYFLDNFHFSKGGGAAEAKVLVGFEEGETALAKWEVEDYPPEAPGKSETAVVTEHVTQGKKALMLKYREKGANIAFHDFAITDWSNFDTLEIDCFNTSKEIVKLGGWFRDEASKDAGYWERHNYQINLKPGASTIHFSVGGFYRGEKGSGKFLDTKKMHSFCLATENVTLYLDSVRLVKGTQETPVAGLKAFDFGPPGSATYPGFSAVQADTAYTAQRGFGWNPNTLPHDSRNYEHPDALFGDYVRCSGGETFTIDVPNGEYCVWAVLDSCNYSDFLYWRTRSIEANGKEAFHETVTPDAFLKEKFFRHQDTEDLPGTDLWQKYIQHQIQPKTFKATVTDGKLNLRFLGDSWGLTLSALVVYPASVEEAGQRWLSQLDARQHDEFNATFMEVVRAADPKPQISAAEEKAGYILFNRGLDRDVSYNSAPGAEPSDTRTLKLDWTACAGEYKDGDLCIYPLKDCHDVAVEVSDLSGPGGAKIPASALRKRAIFYKFKRIGGRITNSYQYLPWLMRDFQTLAVPAGITRRLWFTLKVPDNAAAGKYSGKITVSLNGQKTDVPISLEVYGFKLDEPKMPIGMYGGSGPSGGGWWPAELTEKFRLTERVEEVLRDQKEHGMTAITPASPNLKGFKDGKPEFDYAAADAEMELLRKIGYDHECFTYANFFQVRADSTDAASEKQYGLPLDQAIKAAYVELGAHAKEKNWLPMAWALADEPLIHGISAETVIKVFTAHRKAAPQMHFVSEDAMGDPSHWHVIPAIDIVSANSPRYKVAEAVKQAGGRYWFNNIGTNRLTFGWFLWKAHAEMNVEALFQWGYSTNAGDIYYDLDSSEGDSGVAFTASEGQRARREWEMIREGATDHRYLQTLENLIVKAEGGANAYAKTKAASARKYMQDVMTKIDLEKKNSEYTQADFERIRRDVAGMIQELLKQ